MIKKKGVLDTTNISPDKMLEALDSPLGENGQEHLPSFLCLGILQKHEGSGLDPRGSVETRILVPSSAPVVDVVERGWVSKMELCKG